MLILSIYNFHFVCLYEQSDFSYCWLVYFYQSRYWEDNFPTQLINDIILSHLWAYARATPSHNKHVYPRGPQGTRADTTDPMEVGKARDKLVRGSIVTCEEDKEYEFKMHLDLSEDDLPTWLQRSNGGSHKRSRRAISR